LGFKENPLYTDKGSIDYPNPHPLFQVGAGGNCHSTLDQGLNGEDLFLRNGNRVSIIAKDPNYAIRLQYLEMAISIHQRPDKEITWEEGEVDSLSTVLSTTPSLNQWQKRFDVLFEQAVIYLLLMSRLGINGVPVHHRVIRVVESLMS